MRVSSDAGGLFPRLRIREYVISPFAPLIFRPFRQIPEKSVNPFSGADVRGEKDLFFFFAKSVFEIKPISRSRPFGEQDDAADPPFGKETLYLFQKCPARAPALFRGQNAEFVYPVFRPRLPMLYPA